MDEIKLDDVRYAPDKEDSRNLARLYIEQHVEAGTLLLSDLFYFFQDGGSTVLRELDKMAKEFQLDYMFAFKAVEHPPSRLEFMGFPGELWVRDGLKTHVYDKQIRSHVLCGYLHKKRMKRNFDRSKNPRDHYYNLYVAKQKDGVYRMPLRHAINALISLTDVFHETNQSYIKEVKVADIKPEPKPQHKPQPKKQGDDK